VRKEEMGTNHTEGSEQVLLNDFRRQWADVGPDTLGATERVGESGWYILGNEVQAFETALASHVERRHVIGCANGLDAIEIGLRAMGIRTGERVLTTSLSAFATTLAIVRAGGIPVFVDVDEFGLLDLSLVRRALKDDKTIRFLVPVHLYGHSMDLTELANIEREFEVSILEDCCQAVGAKWGNLSVGSVGRASALSFYPTKNLGALGDAGAVLTDASSVDASSRALRDYGQSSRYHHSVLGLNSRLDELHAAILKSALLPRLTKWTQRRRAIAGVYLSGIKHEHVRVPGAPSGSSSVWHLFPLLVAAQHRESFRAHLAASKIATAIHYPELISRQAALDAVDFEVLGSLTRSEQYCASEVSVPIHPYMTDDEVARVIAAVNTWRQP
jgi:dTDP-3-amino-3,4,6-trideoxy-alpha-D-glucose transaminase